MRHPAAARAEAGTFFAPRSDRVLVAVAPALLDWFSRHRRDLPWRREPRDPYRVWVSEVMLQQTRVETVLRYYERFLDEFPDVAALAAADDVRLMKAWEGMGYYRRARLLRDAARAIVERHGGRVPADAAALRDLPGFGDYTTGAVGSLAFGLALPAIDGNVRRVVSRLTVGEVSPEAWIATHQPKSAPGAFNEALMELGATVCTPRSPRCEDCPLASLCSARAQGRTAQFPAPKPRPARRRVRVSLAVVRRGDAILLERRTEGLLAGVWDLPWVEGDGSALASRVGSLTAGRARIGPRLATARHVFTHREWAMQAYEVICDGERGDWRRPDEVALSSASRKILTSLSRGPSSPSRRRRP